MKREGTLFAIAAMAVFAYVVARAAAVPVIHDEARTYQMFVATGDLLPFHAILDAGNHLLVTALAQVSEALAGPDLFVLRIWSVLGFVLYAWYSWHIGRRVHDPLVRWCLWLALLCTPFVLDFFSLFRGYGLAMGFLMMSIHHLASFVSTRGTGDLSAAVAGIALATFGSLSMLLMCCAIWAGCGALVLLRSVDRAQRRRQAIILLATLLPTLFAAWYSGQLSAAGALYFGSENGLLGGTLPSLAHVVLGSSGPPVERSLLVMFLAVLIMAVRSAGKSFSSGGSPLLVVCMALLVADLAGRIILGEGFGVLYPTDRTAMQLVPLFLIAMALGIDRAGRHHPAVRYAALLLLVLPARTIATANLDHTLYWSEQSIPEEFYRIALDRQRAFDRPLMIGAYHQMPACWRFTSIAEGLGLNELDPTDFPHDACDLLMIDTTFKQPPPGFRTIARSATGHNNLMERLLPLATHMILDSVFSKPPAADEFIDLWKPDPGDVSGRQFFVEWDAEVSPDRDRRAVLVMEVRNAQGEHLMYRYSEPDLSRPVHLALRLPPICPRDGAMAFYIYNARRDTVHVKRSRIKVHQVEP